MEIEVAIPTPLHQTFSYESEQAVPAGSRVLVPFGRRTVVGVSLGEVTAPEERDFELKAIREVIDGQPVYSDVTLEIARWMSRYYLHPLGEVLRTMLPASSVKVVKKSISLTEKGAAIVATEESPFSVAMRALFGKRKSLTDVTLRAKFKKLKATGALGAIETLEDLSKAGLITSSRSSVVKARAQVKGQTDAATGRQVNQALPLTDKQQSVFRTVRDQGILVEKPQKPFLLWGLTGSGKTEIYMQLIAAACDKDPAAQTLVMVPEISLTPQMTKVFEDRFPGQIAVVHSAMNDGERWQELERIRTGQARILIGPRSAVFGPFARLKFLIVDEEHDNSYKQTTGLTYNGRDIAILRGKLEGACVLLGSATPSLESYQNALQEKYHLLTLPERVSGRPLPEVTVIKAKPGFSKGDVVARGTRALEKVASMPIDEAVIEALRENHATGKQAIVLVNRRGYAYYLFSLNEKKAVTCPQCSVSLTMHKHSQELRCHYCDYQTTTQKIMAAHPDDAFLSVGYGSEKVESFLSQQLKGANVVRVDSDTVMKKDMLPQTLRAFREGEIDILVGTQILAKGHDFPNVTLIVILEVDQLLDLPDFRAGERTFQLIVQAAGRAGRADQPGRVLIQTARTDDPVIRAGLEQDFLKFADSELAFRQDYGYPPFQRIVAVELNSTDKRALTQFCLRIDQWFEALAIKHPELTKQVKVLGPSTPPIEMIRRRWRRMILFSSFDTKPMHFILQSFQHAFGKPPGDIRLRFDVDPQSLV